MESLPQRANEPINLEGSRVAEVCAKARAQDHGHLGTEGGIVNAQEASTMRKMRALIVAQLSCMDGNGRRYAACVLEEIDEHLAPKRVRKMPSLDELLNSTELVPRFSMVEGNNAANREN